MEVVAGHLYDYPTYYDIIFGADWKAEYRFLKACFEKFAKRPVKRIFEPACGTGRLLVRLAKDGYEVAGNDLNPRAVEYCNKRLARAGFPATAVVGDMANFSVRKKVDASFNFINTFRHVQTEEEAQAHFTCMADALNKGGIYLLGLHLTPRTPQQCTEEIWKASRGTVTVKSRLWSEGFDVPNRKEHIGVTYDVKTPAKSFRIRDNTVFRTYTAEQMAMLILSEPRFEFVGTYDFRYDMDTPIVVTPETEDVVYVLRKR
jgi:SAM-dependent methyltransferase